MKHFFITCYIMATALLLSCNGHQGNEAKELLPSLAEAERLMYPHPDSALHILQNMQIEHETDAYQRATWAVLLTQARYKCYEKQSDSLINTAYLYFMDKDDEQRKALVNYLKGAIYGEKNDVENAQDYYLKASEYANNIEDYQLAYLIHIHLGQIYLYRFLPDYAFRYLKEAESYARLSGNKRYIASSGMNIARAYSLKPDYDTAMDYYNKVMEYAKENNLSDYMAYSMNEAAVMYQIKKDYKKTLNLLKESFRIKQTDQTKLGLGDAYRNLHQYDSAYYYLNQSILSDNIYTVRSSYQALFYMAKEMKDYEKAVEYSGKLWQYQDSINSMESSKALIEMQEKSDQQRVISERNELEIEKDKTIRNALIGIIALMGIIAILVYTYQRKLLRKDKELQQKEKSIRMFTLKIGENERQISRNRVRMEELQAQMDESKEVQEQWEEQQKVLQEIQKQNEQLKEDNRNLQESINEYTQSSHGKIKGIEILNQLSEENRQLHQRGQFLCNQLVKNNDFFMQLKKAQYVSDEQWAEIKERIDFLFDGYTHRLRDQFSLTESDIQMCCLIKLRFTNSEIIDLLAISPSSVYKRKLRLKERILQEIHSFGENKTLDLWLMEY